MNAVAVCDMSKAFISGIEQEFPAAEVVVDVVPRSKAVQWCCRRDKT